MNRSRIGSRVYVASSWRSTEQVDRVVDHLRQSNFHVYDFRKESLGFLNDHEAGGPATTLPDSGFRWTDIDPNWEHWDLSAFRAGIEHPVARQGAARDLAALVQCDALVMVMPCGKSAHLELGFAIGARKRTVIIAEELPTRGAELMWSLADHIVGTPIEAALLLRWAR